MRIYTINRGQMDEFVRAWREGVVPVRQKVGFTIQKAWIVRETNQFIWVLGYSGPDEWAAKDAEYFNSPERKNMHPDPAQYIARSEAFFLQPVENFS